MDVENKINLPIDEIQNFKSQNDILDFMKKGINRGWLKYCVNLSYKTNIILNSFILECKKQSFDISTGNIYYASGSNKIFNGCPKNCCCFSSVEKQNRNLKLQKRKKTFLKPLKGLIALIKSLPWQLHIFYVVIILSILGKEHILSWIVKIFKGI